MQHLRKNMGDEDTFLPSDKHKRFLQVHSITLGVQSQAYPKYPKLQVCNIFPMSLGKCEG